MNVVILGSGRVGASVAAALDGAGHVVTVVDRNPESFTRLPGTFAGRTLRGNGIDADVLREAGAAEATVFLALTEDDDRNVMAAQVAQSLGSQHAIVRVYDPVRADLFQSVGLLTVSPTVTGAKRLFDLISGTGEET